MRNFRMSCDGGVGTLQVLIADESHASQVRAGKIVADGAVARSTRIALCEGGGGPAVGEAKRKTPELT